MTLIFSFIVLHGSFYESDLELEISKSAVKRYSSFVDTDLHKSNKCIFVVGDALTFTNICIISSLETI